MQELNRWYEDVGHPRTGGEHEYAGQVERLAVGSSPHGRGTLSELLYVMALHRGSSPHGRGTLFS